MNRGVLMTTHLIPVDADGIAIDAARKEGV